MKVQYVTLTGADDKVDPKDLVSLSEKYPFAEWGILFSQSKAGVARYPSLEWVERLFDVKTPKMNLSAHLCGKWVDDATKGHLAFFDDKRYAAAFNRVQFNMFGDKLRQSLSCEPLDKLLKSGTFFGKHVIFGGNYDKVSVDGDFIFNKGTLIFPLFDASGGRGVEAKAWPAPIVSKAGIRVICGYAGGLGPDNVVKELEKLVPIVDSDGFDDFPIWIDMETKLRNKADKFDLEICEKVLKAVEPWVG